MSERRDFTDTAPAKPIVLRPHHPELEPQALAEPERPHSHMTRRRIMYLVGLTLQAAVLAVVVGAFLTFEAPLRSALGLSDPAAPIEAALRELDGKISRVSARVDILSGTIGEWRGDHYFRREESLSGRIERIDAAVASLQAKLDPEGAAATPPLAPPHVD